MADTIKDIQGYGTTLTGNGMTTVPFIDAQLPGTQVTLRETSTLSNVEWATKMVNKLKELDKIDFMFNGAYLDEVKSACGANALFTISMGSAYNFQAWGVLSVANSDSFSARTHDHSVQFTATLEFTLTNSANEETAPVETINF